MNKQNYIDHAEQALLHTYNRFPVVLDHGEGVYLYDTDGKKYLDFAAGIAVCAFGYGKKEYNDALKNQVDKLLILLIYIITYRQWKQLKKHLLQQIWIVSSLQTVVRKQSKVH